MAVTRRQMVGLLTSGLAGAALWPSAGRSAEGPGWRGLHVLGGRKGYADTPMGQVHYLSLIHI